MWNNIKMLNTFAQMLYGICAIAVFAAGIWWLVQRPMFSLRVISLYGIDNAELRHVNALTVRAAALPRLKGNFFTADLDAIRTAFESVPWVRRVAVRREWPNKLIVSVEEHRPIGTWGDEGKLLSAKGDVFTANLAEAEEDGGLLEFAGPPGSEKQVLLRYAELREAIRTIGLEPIAVKLSTRLTWTAKMNNGMTVQFGRESGSVGMNDLVKRLKEVYLQLAAKHEGRIESIDMRYPNGLAIALGTGQIAAGSGEKQK